MRPRKIGSPTCPRDPRPRFSPRWPHHTTANLLAIARRKGQLSYARRVANSAYTGTRYDVLSVLPAQPIDRALDVGCAAGATARALRRLRAPSHITGIELDPELASAARETCDRVIEQDASAALDSLAGAGERFDVVLCGDILEHLVDPWSALSRIRELCPRGSVAVSLPNICHYSTALSLARGHWPYRDRGILDRTHLRFFGRNDLPALFRHAGFREERRVVKYRLLERPHPANDRAQGVIARLPLIRRAFEYQFISLLR